MTILASSVLIDGFDRVRESVTGLLDGLSEENLLWRPEESANSIGWLVWHLSRVQDDHLAGLTDREQVRLADGWAQRFALPYPREAIGYGQSAKEVGQFRASAALLDDYNASVHERTVEIMESLDEQDYTRVVDENWDPPVTGSVRLVSVLNDVTQHVGQAAYVRGLLR